MAVPILKMATIGLLPSILKVNYYRATGAKIGKGVKIGLLSILDVKEIEIGDNTKIGPLTFIKCNKLKLGKRVKLNMMVAIETGEVEIGDDSTVMEQVVIGGMLTPRSIIKIGKRVKIFPYSFLNPTEPITMGDDVGIGGANYIFTHGSWQSVLDGFPVGFGPVTIEKGVWFPWRVFVMPNVTVGEYATIGAGSIITKNIPSRSLAAGSPAKVLRTNEEYIKTFSVEEKDTMLRDIFKEFVEYMNFLEIETRVIQEMPLRISVKQKDKLVIINYQVDQKSSIGSEILISLNPMSENLQNELTNKGLVWFDIGSKSSYYRKEKVWTDIKDFLSRWGIRFDIKG